MTATPDERARGRRWLTPAAWAFGIALFLSLVVHVQLYGALWVLDILRGPPPSHERPPIEIELTIAGPTPPSEAQPASAPDPTQAPPGAEPSSSPPLARAVHRAEATPRQARATRPEPPAPVEPHEAEPRPPPPDVRNLQSITQHSDDPSVPPPPEARFLARENRHVAEETVARVRNAQRDDQETSVSAPASAADDEGNAQTDESADLRDRQGATDRHATPREADAPRPRRADTTPLPSAVASGDSTARGAPTTGTGGPDRGAATGSAGGARAAGGGEPLHTVVHDPFGAFVLVAPSSRPLGAGPGEGGGEARVGRGQGEAGAEQRAGASGGANGQRGRGRGAGESGVDLRVSWSTFERTFTPDQLRDERERYVAERRSRARGGAREQRWREFRSAIENYVPNVRPGNQTALNAAASPFAEYLATVHRRIHREFADRFLAGLPGGTNPFGDHSLMTNLEIILNRDGTVHRVGIVATSGFLPFDYGAFESVMRAQPYPEPPPDILSGDGRVYFHWGFYRNERQCGTFNAEPYILPHPPTTPGRRHGPLQDRPELGGVIPRGESPVLDGASLPAEHGPRESAPPQPSPAPTPDAPGDDTPAAPPPTPTRPTTPDPPGGSVG